MLGLKMKYHLLGLKAKFGNTSGLVLAGLFGKSKVRGWEKGEKYDHYSKDHIFVDRLFLELV